jgi:hypothetical protein
MTACAPSKIVRARRKAARELLRDAQLPGLTDRSRAVLSFKAIRLCMTASLDAMEACLLDAVWPNSEWHDVQAALIERAKRILKSK